MDKSKLAEDYKYKTILSIQRATNIYKGYIDYMYITFFRHAEIASYKILSSQYLLQQNIDKIFVQQTLLSLAENIQNKYNERADAIDTLLHLGDEPSKNKAKTILSTLCFEKDLKKTTVYNNKQNVHEEPIENSVKEFLLELAGETTPTVNRQGIDYELTYDEIYEEVIQLMKNSSKHQEVNNSLLRIKIDQLVYPGSQTLSMIFIKVYDRIRKHRNKDLLLQRLVEELIDMDSTCSSGHASRLVNVFSGVDNFNMNIGFKKQIQGNVFGRLNKFIQEIDDDVVRDKILEQMTHDELESRLQWITFFREHIPQIKDELRHEYVTGGYLKAEEFELYLRDAVMQFEVCG